MALFDQQNWVSAAWKRWKEVVLWGGIGPVKRYRPYWPGVSAIVTTPPQQPAGGQVFRPAGTYITLRIAPQLILADNTAFPMLVLLEQHVEVRVMWRTRLAYADLAPVELDWFVRRRAVRFGLRSGLVHYTTTFTSAEIAESAFKALRAAATG